MGILFLYRNTELTHELTLYFLNKAPVSILRPVLL